MNKAQFQLRPCGSFAPVYRELVSSVVCEPKAPVVRQGMRERLVRCLWFDQDFEEVLRTEAGQKLTVLSPGWGNLESGPDFKHAAVKFGRGKAVKGDVETHVYASGWKQHGHHEDETYNNVILHVVMWNDSGLETTTLQDGRETPILALDQYVSRGVDELAETLNTEEYPHTSTGNAGRCQELLSQGGIDPEWVGQFLDHAGDERMLKKASRFDQMPEAGDPEALLYVSLMEAAGFKKNKRPMGQLARLVPLETANKLVRENGVVSLHAAMFGMSGLLPQQFELAGPEPDSETAAYLSHLRDQWAAVKDSLEGQPMEYRAWKLSGTRPVNYPMRRIAGISRLLEKAAQFGGVIAPIERELRRVPAVPSRRVARSPAAKAVIELLTGLSDDYWSRRTTFGGKKLRSQTKLIGASRAAIMFVDAIVTIMLAQARAREDRVLEKRLHRAYATLPRLPSNSVLRFMSSRIFGGEEPADEVVTSARRQQGLLQLFRDYCEKDSEGCRRCAFAEALEAT